MKNQNVLIAHPQNDKQLNTIKYFFEALKIKFEITEKSPYNKTFVEKIQQSKQQYENGEFISVEKKDINKLLGLE